MESILHIHLLPWIKRWEGEIALKLFTPEERQSYSRRFNTDALLRADFDTRMDGWQKAIAARIVNPNEARAAENRPPYTSAATNLKTRTYLSPLPVVPA